jgi:hypothetical protein
LSNSIKKCIAETLDWIDFIPLQFYPFWFIYWYLEVSIINLALISFSNKFKFPFITITVMYDKGKGIVFVHVGIEYYKLSIIVSNYIDNALRIYSTVVSHDTNVVL